MLKKRKNLLLPMLVLCCAVVPLTGCSLLPVEEEELAPPLIQPVKETFSVYEAKQTNIAKQITGVATFASDKMDYLYYKESGGRLVSMNVKLNDRVKSGDVVATTETEDLETKIRLQEIAIEKIELQMKQEIAASGEESPEFRSKMLDLESATLQLKSLKSQLDKARLVATVDGIVTYIDPIQPGEQVTAYKQLVTIADPKQMKLVYTGSSQNDLAGVEIHMDVDVKIKGTSYKGKVVQTPMTAPPNNNKAIQDKNAKSLIIAVEGLPADVTIGSQADITIVTEKRENVLVIPRAGLRSYMGRDYVQVLDGESRKEIDVEKGIVAATEVEIRKGLTEGQKVILNN
ncbi:efflux RND transporter periplasmic adaptor subunit [Paenibacillus hamazuiensis]|uniref:efflux RND transporter periplasmic adaptor subunit n=1 Tax=Paenibacillus hamazuiensis TaxID=2936508 RepID=UPI0020106C12|nr:HlyD family efflux transporter periplasmic adaptor subunit [Paenibacillus hamazuiensis]